MCEHEWYLLSTMKTGRHNDNTFYCTPGYRWCVKCGSIQVSKMGHPYSETSISVINPRGEDDKT